MTDAQTTAELAETPEASHAEASITAMKTAGDAIHAAIMKAWPTFVDDYAKDGPHPLGLVADILCGQQWVFTKACVQAEGKTDPDEVFFETAKTCLIELTEGLQRVGNVLDPRRGEMVQ